ncbi:hypothetical protein ONZ51_g13051 [Trametes cubensis]|uniref:Uncharacterized protein n=1 Tax=Trametes cubensis TaxID=1111947 RepID=A0AAD7X4Y2_9APHY|nr:hypothetical protein ONZ51_g13051 [Trametes cubensis]
MTATVVYVERRGRAPRNRRNETRIAEIVYFDATVRPEEPLHIGKRVQLRELKKTPADGIDDEEDEYVIMGTGVEGTIIGIRAVEKETIDFVVKNDCAWSMTELAYLTVDRSDAGAVHLMLVRPMQPSRDACRYCRGETTSRRAACNDCINAPAEGVQNGQNEYLSSPRPPLPVDTNPASMQYANALLHPPVTPARAQSTTLSVLPMHHGEKTARRYSAMEEHESPLPINNSPRSSAGSHAPTPTLRARALTVGYPATMDGGAVLPFSGVDGLGLDDYELGSEDGIGSPVEEGSPNDVNESGMMERVDVDMAEPAGGNASPEALRVEGPPARKKHKTDATTAVAMACTAEHTGAATGASPAQSQPRQTRRALTETFVRRVIEMAQDDIVRRILDSFGGTLNPLLAETRTPEVEPAPLQATPNPLRNAPDEGRGHDGAGPAARRDGSAVERANPERSANGWKVVTRSKSHARTIAERGAAIARPQTARAVARGAERNTAPAKNYAHIWPNSPQPWLGPAVRKASRRNRRRV